MTAGMGYSRIEVCADIKSAAWSCVTLHPKVAYTKTVKTACLIRDKIICNIHEYLIDKFNQKCECNYDPCLFHCFKHPLYRDFYDTRPFPSKWWIAKKVIYFKCQDAKKYIREEYKKAPRRTEISLLAIGVFISYAPKTSGALAGAYGVYLIGRSIYRTFD